MKSFTLFMHNIYAMGGTVKSVTQLANTLAQKDILLLSFQYLEVLKRPISNCIKILRLKYLLTIVLSLKFKGDCCEPR